MTRARPRWAAAGTVATAALTAACSSSPAPPHHPVVTPAPVVVVGGDGVAGVPFGTPQPAAIAGLRRVLGRPVPPVPRDEAGNCDVDAAVQWPSLTAYLDRGRFVGFSTLAADGERLARGAVRTAAGLRVGDALAQARRLYGAALTTSVAQGGTWFATTPQGRLQGYLTGEPDVAGAHPGIDSIEAGAVGCPAASP